MACDKIRQSKEGFVRGCACVRCSVSQVDRGGLGSSVSLFRWPTLGVPGLTTRDQSAVTKVCLDCWKLTLRPNSRDLTLSRISWRIRLSGMLVEWHFVPACNAEAELPRYLRR